MKSIRIVWLLMFGILILQNCANEPSEPEVILSVFGGAPEDIARAEAMYEAIGGKKNWANIKSLYVKAIHNEKGIEQPYTNEIWREFDEFKLKIEQKNESFHRRGYFSMEGGWIEYVYEDSVRALNGPVMRNMMRNHEKNIYILLNKLASTQGVIIKTGVNDRLEFHQNFVMTCAFMLDEENRPIQFITRNEDGFGENVSRFTEWSESNGFVHPIAGGPADSTFYFNTEIWQPDNKPFTDVNFVYEAEIE